MRQTLAVLLLIGGFWLTSCTRLHFDSSGGAETVYLKSLDHRDDFDITYLRKPEEGPIKVEKDAYTIFWFIPLNHPDLGMWIEQTLPPGTDAANVSSSVKTKWYGNILFFLSLGTVKIERVRYQMDPVIFKPRRVVEEEIKKQEEPSNAPDANSEPPG